jgi:hypothetical protein
MNNSRVSIRAAWLLAGVLLTSPLALPSPARAADIFDFIPWGGRTLLARVLATRPSAADTRVLLTGKHSREEWLKVLQDRGKTVPALQRLSEKEQLTLADYLSHNMPLPANKVPADPARANWEKLLPMDGKDMALDYCQSCHIITVVVTQDRAREHWLGTLNKPSHIEIKLTHAQREALVSYLVINAAIPIDQVPEDLRAGGATY